MDRLSRQVRLERERFGHADGDLAGIARAWPAAVGETVARNAWPARLARDGTLHVNAVSATWAFELGRMAATILEQLRPELGRETPAALRVAPGPIPGTDAERTPKDTLRRPDIKPGDHAEAAALASAIEDEELREVVARAAAGSLARARSDRGF